jgi:hypothetical protein
MGYTLVILGILFLALSFVPFYAFLPACDYWEIRTSIGNGEESNQNIGFFLWGSFVQVNVYVYGGDRQLTVYLMDSSGDVFNQGVIDGSGTFFFQVPKNDFYSLYLKNDFKWFSENNKQILVKVYYYFYRDFFLFSGTAMLIIGFMLIIYYIIQTQLLSYSPTMNTTQPNS